MPRADQTRQAETPGPTSFGQSRGPSHEENLAAALSSFLSQLSSCLDVPRLDETVDVTVSPGPGGRGETASPPDLRPMARSQGLKRVLPAGALEHSLYSSAPRSSPPPLGPPYDPAPSRWPGPLATPRAPAPAPGPIVTGPPAALAAKTALVAAAGCTSGRSADGRNLAGHSPIRAGPAGANPAYGGPAGDDPARGRPDRSGARCPSSGGTRH